MPLLPRPSLRIRYATGYCRVDAQPLAARRRSPSRAARLRGAVLAIAAAALLTACASAPAGNGEGETGAPLGSFSFSDPTVGSQTVLPAACFAGGREFFLGFDLVDQSSGLDIRLVVDPATGPVIRVFALAAPFDRTILFQRADCREFHFLLAPTGWRINGVRQLDVSLELDCQLANGDRIVGKASDPGCL